MLPARAPARGASGRLGGSLTIDRARPAAPRPPARQRSGARVSASAAPHGEGPECGGAPDGRAPTWQEFKAKLIADQGADKRIGAKQWAPRPAAPRLVAPHAPLRPAPLPRALPRPAATPAHTCTPPPTPPSNPPPADRPVAGSALDFGHYFGEATSADVRLRLVMREKPKGRRPRRASAGVGGGGGAAVVSSMEAEDGSDADVEDGAGPEPEAGGGGGGSGGGVAAESAGGGAPARAPRGGGRRAGGRRVVAELPGHALLLREASAWAQEQLSGQAAAENEVRGLGVCLGCGTVSRPRFAARAPPHAAGPFPPLSRPLKYGQLEVEVEDELEAAAAKLVLQCIYSTSDPARPLAGADPDTLLAVARLAGRLEVPCAVQAAGRGLVAAAGHLLPWDAAVAAFALPLHTPALAAAARQLQAAAADTLQAELGDVDLAWQDAARRAKLLQLPYEAVRCLLSDGRTRVVSENSVFYTADAWLNANGAGGGGAASRQQQAGLAACVRVPHLTPSYLAAVAAQSEWFGRAIGGAYVLLEAVAYNLAAPRIRALHAGALGVDTPLLGHAAWQLPRRPPSGAERLHMEWDVPLATLRRLHREAQREGAAEDAAPATWVWGGIAWALEVQAEADDDTGAVEFGVFVTPALPPLSPTGPARAPAALVEARLSLSARCRHEGRKLRAGGRMAMLLGREGRGFNDLFGLGRRTEWDEAAWRDAGLVGDGETVRVRATVRELTC
jgi:hypothetical protein